MAEPFHCVNCEKPVDLHSANIQPVEAAMGEMTCLRCFYEYHTGTATPTQEQLPEGWTLEEWIDLPVRTDKAYS